MATTEEPDDQSTKQPAGDAGEGAGAPHQPVDIPAPGPPGPYPRLIGRQLMTPTAPLAPGAAMRVYPAPILPHASPARWAEDPAGRHQWRWWNGASWTDHVADDGVTSDDPLD